jgi:ATP-dependent RNA helicase RhlE
VHRIGRTGRAGASGSAISFCDAEERTFLKDIQQLIGQQLPVASGHPYEPSGTTPVALQPPRGKRPPSSVQPSGPKPNRPKNEHPSGGGKNRRSSNNNNWSRRRSSSKPMSGS